MTWRYLPTISADSFGSSKNQKDKVNAQASIDRGKAQKELAQKASIEAARKKRAAEEAAKRAKQKPKTDNVAKSNASVIHSAGDTKPTTTVNSKPSTPTVIPNSKTPTLTPPKTTPTPTKNTGGGLPNTGGSGGSYGGGGGGGGATYASITGNGATSTPTGMGNVPTLSAPAAPKFVQPDPLKASLSLQSWNPSFDGLDYYRPDYDAFSQAYDGTISSLEGMRTNYADQANLTREQAQRSLDTILQDIQSSRKENAQQFQQTRQGVLQDMMVDQIGTSEDLSARGIADSGFADLAEAQTRMEAGNQVSNIADSFYDTEEVNAKNREQAQTTHNDANRQVAIDENSFLTELQKEIANIGLQKTTQIEGLRQNEHSSQQELERYKKDAQERALQYNNQNSQILKDHEMAVNAFNAQQFNSQQEYDLAYKSFQQQLAEYEASRIDADRNYGLNKDQFSESIRQFNESLGAQRASQASSLSSANSSNSLAREKWEYEKQQDAKAWEQTLAMMGQLEGGTNLNIGNTAKAAADPYASMVDSNATTGGTSNGWSFLPGIKKTKVGQNLII